jgi:sulfopyruvate decarboxylase TPP-binding subunit
MADVNEIVNGLSAEFDQLCVTRHEKGQKVYGVLTFMGNDIFTMLNEELADAANYLRYQYIKIRMLMMMLAGELDEVTEAQINIGVSSFRSSFND